MPHKLSTAQRASLAAAQQQQGPGWDRTKTPAKSALKAAAAAAAGEAVSSHQLQQSEDEAMQEPPSQEQQQGAAAEQQASQQQQQEQQQELPGNGYLSLVAASPDGLVPGQEVLQLRLRKLLGVMRVLTCTGGCCVCVVVGAAGDCGVNCCWG
jgi:hypothetical protein